MEMLTDALTPDTALAAIYNENDPIQCSGMWRGRDGCDGNFQGP
jgi:hypothetical protein